MARNSKGCREICRRTFRGCLRIPGCKTICFKCILPPCCSSDSDDEKDEKDDEGYDSYGITASQNHLPEPHHLISKPPTEKDVECHDYVNESELELTTSHVETKLAEVMYVAMNDTSDDEDKMASKPSGQYSVVVDTNTCNNNRHDYVNESVLFAKSDRERDQDASFQRNGDQSVHTDFGNDCINGCREIFKQNSQQVTDSVVVKEYETRSLESKVADAVSNQQTLILLETDL
ncbi:Hypothetical predicted protein [Mytilus galloprovincialis]|uniref:Uncharacterized protein n=1 Tax=Mytilus galloprovincialis TaxID=29158 RepID=A0A8B6FU71_MYTGA|nr:Hypothetical predicted protein [Mytilus galloprovincialis]